MLRNREKFAKQKTIQLIKINNFVFASEIIIKKR